jgi:hypothetical protein
MERKLLKIFLPILLILPVLLFTATRITGFHARRLNNAVILEWTTEEEGGLVKFQIQRSTDSVNWLNIGEKMPIPGQPGDRKVYTFTDNSIFKTHHTGTFYYRLIIVDSRGNSTPHDVIVSISGNSGLRHTWGSIKAMFR